MREFVSAAAEATRAKEAAIAAARKAAEDAGIEYVEEPEEADESQPFIEFLHDGRRMKAYQPHSGQLTFMMATLSRGQTDNERFSSILTLMFQTFAREDRDYLESRIVSNDPAKKMEVAEIEEIFEMLMEEWFGIPTQEP